MSVRGLLDYLSLSQGDSREAFSSDSGLSLLPSKKIHILKSAQLKSMDQSVALSNFFTIFSGIKNVGRYAFSGVVTELTRGYQYFSNHYYSFKLQKAGEKFFASLQGEATPSVSEEVSVPCSRLIAALKARADKGEVADFLVDESRLMALSHLRKSGAALSIEEEVFHALFHGKGSYKPKAVELIVEYMKAFLTSETLERSQLTSLNKAAEKDELLRKIITQGKSETSQERKGKLRSLAQTMSIEGEGLGTGKSFVVFGGIRNGKASESPFTEGILKELLPHDLHALLKDEGRDQSVERLTQKLLGELWGEEDVNSKKRNQVKDGIHSLLSKVSCSLESALPSTIYESILESLKKDFDEIILGPVSADGGLRVGEGIWEQFKDNGLEKILQEEFLKAFQNSREVIDAQMEIVNEHVLATIPTAARPILDTLGLPKGEEEAVWFEIEKQGNGNFKVTLFAEGGAAEPHPNGATKEKKGVQLPLIYSDVEPEKLDESFFYSLLSYRAIPEWERGTRFTIQDIHDGLIESLGRPPEAPTNDTLVSFDDLNGEGAWKYASLYLRHHLQLNQVDFEKSYSYEMRLQAFISMWSRVQADENYLATHPLEKENLKIAIAELSDVGLDLHEKGKLSIAELQSLHATIWEAEKFLKVEKLPAQTASSVIIPSDLQEMVKQFILIIGVTPTQIAQIKEMLVIIYGSEIDNVLDQVIEDILPTLSVDEMNQARSNRKSESLYTWDGIKSNIENLQNFRFSIYHCLRLYLGISKIFSDIVQKSIASSLIEKLIVLYCPGLATYTSMNAATLSRLLACFGPSVLKPILPESLYQSIRAIYNLFKEAVNYVKRRALFVGVRIAIRLLLGGESASQLSVQARNWSQKITRSGELSYQIPHGKNDIGQLHLKPEAVPITLGATKEKDPRKIPIGAKISEYSSTSALPRPYSVILTKDNLKEELSRWILEAEILSADQGLSRSYRERSSIKLLYLNRQFRNLELPGTSAIWDEVDSIETMKLLQQIISQMKSGHLSPDERAEVITTTYTAYALIDHLARRCVDTHLPDDLRANGRDLAQWLQSPGARVTNLKTYSQLKQTAHYFGFDLKKAYSADEIEGRSTGYLFNYQGQGESFYTPAFVSSDIGSGQVTPTYRGLMYSRDGAYYRMLLKDGEVQHRLSGCNLGKNPSEWEQFITLFKNPKGSHGCPLPEAFKILRNIDSLARSSVTFGFLTGKQLDIQTPWQDGDYWFVPETLLKMGRALKSGVHAVTRNHLRREDFSGSLSGLHVKPVVNIHTDGLRERYLKRGREHHGNESNSKDPTLTGINAFFSEKSRRSVNQIVAQAPLELENVSPLERRLLEMITQEKSTQVINALGFFKKNRGRLSEPRFRFIFDLLINRVGALETQISERPEIAFEFGKFFKEMFDHFEKQGDLETCLYLAKIGQEFRQSLGDLGTDSFPDFRSYLRYRLIPHLRTLPTEERLWKFGDQDVDLLIISYYHLILTYGSLNPDTLDDGDRNQIIEDIARLSYTSLRKQDLAGNAEPDVWIKAQQTIFLWQPHIKAAIASQPDLRKNVIENILRDIGMESMNDKEDEWKGTYPIYSNGKITLDLEEQQQTTHEISIDLARERAQSVVCELGNGFRLSKRSFSFPDKKVVIEFSEGTFKGETPVTLRHQFNGYNYEYLSPDRMELIQAGKEFSLASDEQLWLECPRLGRARNLLCLKDGKEQWKRPVQSAKDERGNPCFEVRWNRKTFEDTIVREVNLKEEPHGLALLNWFEDESGIKAYAHSTDPDRLAFIEIPKWNLKFGVQECGGALEAMDLGDHTGYFLSREQRDEKLLKYGKYLLMENTRGQKKVSLVTKPLKSIMAEFVIGNLAKIKTSPLINQYIEAFTSDSLSKESLLLTFNLDEKGNLTTSDPMGFAYLALFNFISGDRSASLHYFSELESYGRKHPYPKEIHAIFELMYLPLLCAQDEFSREMTLRLGAIQAENQLIQHREDSGEASESPKKNDTVKLLKWVLLQVKYSEYLSGVAKGLPKTLNDYQELFILSGMSRMNKEYYQHYVGDGLPETVKQLCRSIGVENLANTFLFLPAVMERYHELRCQLEKNSSALTNTARGLTIQAVQSFFSDVEESGPEGSTKGGLNQLVRLVNQVKKSQLTTSTFSGWNVELFTKNVKTCSSLNEVPTAIWELNGESLQHYFPVYYRLVKNEQPARVDTGLFKQKREELLRSLELMSGQYTPDENLQREILQVVARRSRGVSFPSARVLEDRIKRVQDAPAKTVYAERKSFEEFLNGDFASACKQARVAQALFTRANGFRVVNSSFWLIKTFAFLIPGYSHIAVPTRLWRWAKRGLSFTRAIRHEQTRETDLSDSITSRARSTLKKDPLELDLANTLKEQEGDLNRDMDTIVDEFFHTVQEPSLFNRAPIAPYRADSEEEAIKQNFEEVDASIKDCYARPQGEDFRFEMKEGKNPEVFIKKARGLTESLNFYLEEQEKIIVDMVKKGKKLYREKPGQQIVEKIHRQKLGNEVLDFNQIYDLFTQCDDEAMCNRTEISLDIWKDLKRRLYLYQVVRRRYNLLFKQLGQLVKGDLASIEAMARALRMRPAYDIGQDIPELLIRAKLSYEVALGFMLYNKALQSEQLDRLLLSHFEDVKKVVLEQIMGTGKTFLTPISNRVFGDGNSLVVNVVIDPIAPSNFEMFTGYAKKAYKQVGSIFRFSRSMKWTTEQLAALFQLFSRSTHLGEQMNSRQKDLQSFELRFIEECIDTEGKFEPSWGGEWKKRLQHYKDSLRLFDEVGVENSDEKHKIDEPSTGILNFPLGPASTLRDEEIDVMNEVVLLLASPEFRETITIKQKRPEKLPPAIYEMQVKKRLAKKVASLLDLFKVKKKNQVEFETYLMGQSKTVPAFVNNSPHKRAIGQAKGLITVLFPFALNNVINVDFTVSKQKGNGEYARPSEGNDAPLENSTILKPDEAYVKTLFRLFQTRLNEEQLKRLIVDLHEEAQKDKIKKGCHIQETQAARFFALHCAGHQIDTYKAEDLPKIYAQLNKSDRAMTLYATRFIAKDIKFYKRFLSSNYQNFHSLFGKKQYSRTGTPKNKRVYPTGTKILHHLGTEGESVLVLEKKLSEAGSIQVLEHSDPRKALHEMIYRFFHVNPKLTALIDLDPICNNLSPEAINEEFQKYIAEHRPDMQGVVFYDKDKKLVIAEKGSKSPTPFEESSVALDKRITIFDHTHTTAADVRQAPDAEALLTIGENITLTDLAQAFDRMREARRGNQKVIIVMTKKAREKMGLGPNPTARDIIKLAMTNEPKELTPAYYQAARYELQDILRRAILKKAKEAPTIEQTIAIIRKFQDILVMTVQDDPFEIYGYVDVMKNPREVLRDYQDQLLSRVNIRNSDFSPAEQINLRAEMNEVGKGVIYSEEVRVYEKNGSPIDSTIPLGQQTQQVQSNENENENDQETDNDVNVNVHQNAAPMTPEIEEVSKVHAPWNWSDDLDPTDVDAYFQVTSPRAWRLPMPVPIYSLRDFVGLKEEFAFLSQKMSSQVYVSENFAQQRDNRWVGKAGKVDPFGKKQTPLFKALVIQDKREGILNQRILLLHKDEVGFWQKKLAEDQEATARSGMVTRPDVKVALYDFASGIITASGGNTLLDEELNNDPNFIRASVQVKFATGELSYAETEQAVLASWIKSLNQPQKVREAFKIVHKEKNKDRYFGSDIETIFFNAAGVPLDMRIKV